MSDDPDGVGAGVREDSDDARAGAGDASDRGSRVRAGLGALGFLTTIPVGRDEAAWRAFSGRPAAAVVAGYAVGCPVAAIAVVATGLSGTPLAASGAFAVVASVYALVGVNNLDGVADCGDALVVHGDVDRRRAVLGDTTTGVGAIVAVALVLLGLAAGAMAVQGTTAVVAVAVVVATEVGARTGLASLAAVATAPHDGLGRALTDRADGSTVGVALALALPAVAWPTAAAIVAGGTRGTGRVDATAVVLDPVALAAVGGFLGALAATALVGRWATSRLGGVNGDAFGAASELARVAGLHVGVIAWTLS